jgi:sugar transferase (PEP-CTERM/EpsH1 system associated)
VRILFVVPYVPNLVRVRPYQLIRNLSNGGHQVILGTLWTDEQEFESLTEMEEVCERVVAKRIQKVKSLSNCMMALPTSKPLQYVYSWEPSLERELEKVILQNQAEIDVIHVEHLRGAQYGTRLQTFLRRNQLPIPIIWDSVDSISNLFRQSRRKSKQAFKRWLTQFELSRTESYECKLANKFERVLVTSAVDRNHFLTLNDGSQSVSEDQISILPNGVDLTYFHPCEEQAREEDVIVVSGKMSYHANISMTLFLVSEIMPLIWEKRPEVRLWIVGKDPSQEIVKLAQKPQITVTGMVPDLGAYLRQATLAVAPMVYGTGIQNKVLEAMACGTPVVTSPQALNALEAVAGKDLEQATTPVEYAEKILYLLKMPKYRQDLGKAGRIYVENHHRWPVIAERLAKIYYEEKKN